MCTLTKKQTYTKGRAVKGHAVKGHTVPTILKAFSFYLLSKKGFFLTHHPGICLCLESKLDLGEI